MFEKSLHYKGIYRKISAHSTLVKPYSSSKDPKYRPLVAVIGAQLGDEGKGRIIDNKLSRMSTHYKEFYVVRSQGGSNAGHTVQHGDKKIGLHQIPSAVFHDNAKLILDFGMVIHPEDLLSEIIIVEKMSSSLVGRIFLSHEAMMCTDLERAKDVLNRGLDSRSKGSTGRGIAPSTAGRSEKTGLTIDQLISSQWQETLEKHYDNYEKFFTTYGEDISTYDVPDFKLSKESSKAHSRTVGNKGEFISRLSRVRDEFLKRGIVTDTFLYHQSILASEAPILFEMAQGVGLSPAFGTRPDTTTTETTAMGITLGTRVYRVNDISERIGVMKATYMSSVGARTMPTEASDEWSQWVRDFAHEYGTTTGRPRDICYLDLPFLKYNISIGEINQLAMTHLDVSREDLKIKVCIGYKKDGVEVTYKPELGYLSKLKPIFIEFDGWDSEECSKATTFAALPENAKLFVHFVESAMNIPISILTTGPDRESIIERGKF